MAKYDTTRVNIAMSGLHDPVFWDINEDEATIEDLGTLIRDVMIEHGASVANVQVWFSPTEPA